MNVIIRIHQNTIYHNMLTIHELANNNIGITTYFEELKYIIIPECILFLYFYMMVKNFKYSCTIIYTLSYYLLIDSLHTCTPAVG